MLGNVILVVLILVEIVFMVLSMRSKSNRKREKAFVRIAIFILFLLLVISPIIEWSFRWYGVGLLLLIQAVLGTVVIIHKKENTDVKNIIIIVAGLGRCLLVGMTVVPAIVFPQYLTILPTGESSVGTAIYTWTDESREEYFTEAVDHRKVTVQFFYPTEEEGKTGATIDGASIAAGDNYPLVIFSHGAFGYRRSNYSTYLELASHGYIVCSIDHTYHAFMTKEEDGNTILANQGFLNEVKQVQNEELVEEEVYDLSKKWLELRTGDMKFVLNTIKQQATSDKEASILQSINLERIGALGHSLGGAASAQIGRDIEDVDAVIVIDGTMLGETIGYKDGKEMFIETAYPKPIMNLYNESHYDDAVTDQDSYANMIVSKNAMDSYQVVVNGSGHLNFTDLPLISPILASVLGTGDVDARNCILTTNEVVLQFFDHYLKDSDVEIPRERVY